MKLKDVLLAGLAGGLAALLVVAVAGLVGNQSANPLGSRFPNGISVDSTQSVAGQIRGTTLTVTGAATGAAADYSGEVEAALVEEGTIVTRTAGATTTISAANVCDANIVQWAPLVALASTTLPTAVDVIADCLTTNGDTITFLFRNTTSTSLTSVLAADASTTLVGSAATDDQIDGGNEALITFWRTGSDTAVVEIEELVAAD